MWDWFFNTTGFIPRKLCVTSDPNLQYSAMAAEILTGVAYMGIPVMLVILWRKRPQLIPSASGLFAFVAFILFCGFGHFFDALVWEYPVYHAWILSRWATGLVSFSALLMLPVIYGQLKKYRSSAEYHDMADKANEERLKAEVLRVKAERKSERMEREFAQMDARIQHLHHIGVTVSEIEALKLQLQRIRRVESAA